MTLHRYADGKNYSATQKQAHAKKSRVLIGFIKQSFLFVNISCSIHGMDIQKPQIIRTPLPR